jgi:hypothetical protein
VKSVHCINIDILRSAYGIHEVIHLLIIVSLAFMMFYVYGMVWYVYGIIIQF